MKTIEVEINDERIDEQIAINSILDLNWEWINAVGTKAEPNKKSVLRKTHDLIRNNELTENELFDLKELMRVTKHEGGI